jgi:hypothetical protein
VIGEKVLGPEHANAFASDPAKQQRWEAFYAEQHRTGLRVLGSSEPWKGAGLTEPQVLSLSYFTFVLHARDAPAAARRRGCVDSPDCSPSRQIALEREEFTALFHGERGGLRTGRHRQCTHPRAWLLDGMASLTTSVVLVWGHIWQLLWRGTPWHRFGGQPRRGSL